MVNSQVPDNSDLPEKDLDFVEYECLATSFYALLQILIIVLIRQREIIFFFFVTKSLGESLVTLHHHRQGKPAT